MDHGGADYMTVLGAAVAQVAVALALRQHAFDAIDAKVLQHCPELARGRGQRSSAGVDFDLPF
jgi:hypothetical protein